MNLEFFIALSMFVAISFGVYRYLSAVRLSRQSNSSTGLLMTKAIELYRLRSDDQMDAIKKYAKMNEKLNEIDCLVEDFLDVKVKDERTDSDVVRIADYMEGAKAKIR